MQGTQKECDYIVSILNAIIEKNGNDVSEVGFGYDEEGYISTADGFDLETSLKWVWEEIFLAPNL